jgi:hypothetical protein
MHYEDSVEQYEFFMIIILHETLAAIVQTQPRLLERPVQ